MSSDFNYNFGFVFGEIFELGHAIKFVLRLRSQLSENFYKNWSLKPVRVFHICPEMRCNSKWYFAFVVDEFSWLRHTIRTSTHGHGSKKLDTQQPLKWSLEPSKSISAFRALVGNTKRVFTMFWFCTNCINFVWLTGTLKTTYPAVRNSSRFPTKIPFESAEMSVYK